VARDLCNATARYESGDDDDELPMLDADADDVDGKSS
jgi:hypothetical protein